MLTPGLRHAFVAMAAPALKHRPAAHRARHRIRCETFDVRHAPQFGSIWPRLQVLARRLRERRRLRTGFRSARGHANGTYERFCAPIGKRTAERLCEVGHDWPQTFAPMRQRECEFIVAAALR
jgi:hypothetical protein